MKVLVTGGAGYIGSHVCKALSAAGMLPVTHDNLSVGHRWAVKWWPLVTGDLQDIGLVRETMRRYNIGAVMHFAAHTQVGESVKDPRKYYKNNLANTLLLLVAMVDSGIRHIVFSSTCAVYCAPETEFLYQTHPLRPVNPYGETKLAVERARALGWYGKAFEIEWMALRYFNAAGADEEGKIGEAHDNETHLIPLVLDAAITQRAVSVFGDDYPTLRWLRHPRLHSCVRSRRSSGGCVTPSYGWNALLYSEPWYGFRALRLRGDPSGRKSHRAFCAGVGCSAAFWRSPQAGCGSSAGGRGVAVAAVEKPDRGYRANRLAVETRSAPQFATASLLPQHAHAD